MLIQNLNYDYADSLHAATSHQSKQD